MVKSIDVNHSFVSKLVLFPNLDTEGVRLIIASPNLELIWQSIGIQLTIDCSFTLELGIVTAGDETALSTRCASAPGQSYLKKLLASWGFESPRFMIPQESHPSAPELVGLAIAP